MNRRAFLAGTAGASTFLAGCSGMLSGDAPGADPGGSGDGDESSDGSENGHDDENGPTDGSGIPTEEPTVVDFETAPLSASVVGGTFSTDDRLHGTIDFSEPETGDGPARLVARLENRKPFEQTFRPRRVVFFDDPATGRNGDRDAIYLAPTWETEVAETVPDAVQDDGGRWRVDSVRDDWYPEALTLDAGETLDAEFVLLGHHDRGEPAIEPGNYRFGWRDAGFTVAVWRTDEPGPGGDSRFAGESVPALTGEAEMAWFHGATPETEVFLRPSEEAIEAPGRIEFELVNRTREMASGNPYYWRVHKLVNGAWRPVAPWVWNQPLSYVGPGGVDESALHCYHGEPIRAGGARAVGHLGGGRYAYEIGYSVGEETHAAMFDLDAPALSIDVDEDAVVHDEGEELVVTLPDHEDARRPATFTVSRLGGVGADGSGVGGRIIEEQLPRHPFRGFRNALPRFEAGVERVRVKTDRTTALRPVGYEDGGTTTVEYDGQAYEAVGEELG